MNLSNKYAIFFIISIIVVTLLVIYTNIINRSLNDPKKIEITSPYHIDCLRLYEKINNPNPSFFIKPPLRSPPPEMYDEFTQNGEMPITKYWYLNDAYSDSKNDQKRVKKVFTQKEIDSFLKLVRENKPLIYNDMVLNELIHHFRPSFKNKTVVIIGTNIPWVEAITLDVDSSRVVSLDYTHNSYETPRLEWMHVSDYLHAAIKNRHFENFDHAVSFSSLEHAGLGRYGDPLNPNGDIEAVQQVHCMLKPGGLFFLALPTSSDDSSYIEFNAHRVYGSKRLNRLFKNWTHLISRKDSSGVHTIFVLQKT